MRIDNKQSIQAVVSDLDGTLLNSDGKPDAQALVLLEEFQKKGGYFIIATSRHLHNCESIAKSILKEYKGYLICSNGMYIYDSENNLLKTFSYIDKQGVRAICEAYQGCQLTLVTDGSDYVWNTHETLFGMIKNFITNFCINIKFASMQKRHIIKDYDDVSKPVEKIIVRLRKGVGRDILNNRFNHFSHNNTQIIEFQNSNTDKTIAVEYLLKQHNIPGENVVVFGDDENDKKLLQNFRLSFAMGNSRDDIKKCAKYVTSDNDEHGVYNALIEIGV